MGTCTGRDIAEAPAVPSPAIPPRVCPHTHSVPSDLMAYQPLPTLPEKYALRAVIPVKAFPALSLLIWTGAITSVAVTVPIPTCPWLLSPQDQTFPFMSIAAPPCRPAAADVNVRLEGTANATVVPGTPV